MKGIGIGIRRLQRNIAALFPDIPPDPDRRSLEALSVSYIQEQVLIGKCHKATVFWQQALVKNVKKHGFLVFLQILFSP